MGETMEGPVKMVANLVKFVAQETRLEGSHRQGTSLEDSHRQVMSSEDLVEWEKAQEDFGKQKVQTVDSMNLATPLQTLEHKI